MYRIIFILLSAVVIAGAIPKVGLYLAKPLKFKDSWVKELLALDKYMRFWFWTAILLILFLTILRNKFIILALLAFVLWYELRRSFK